MKVKSGSLQGWTTRDGEHVEGFQAELEADMKRKPLALIWYVNRESKVPSWIQLPVLWIKRCLRLRLP